VKRIPTRLEVQSQGPVNLELLLLNADDRSLPKPRGKTEKPKTPSPRELARLERTKQAGGLVDDNVTIVASKRGAEFYHIK
jgi:hypothetical protein